MIKPLRLLQIEDYENDAAMVVRILTRAGFEVDSERVEDGDELKEALAKRDWDVIISDYRLPQFDAPAALDILKHSGLDLPFIVVSGTIGEDLAVRMMKSGAHDYIMKNNLTRLPPAVEREIQESIVRRERRYSEARLREAEERYRDLFENSPVSLAVIDPDTGRYVECNRMFCERLGYTPQEIAHLRVEDIDTGAAKQKLLTDLTRNNIELPTQYRTKSGELVDTLVTTRPIRRDNRMFLHSIAIDLSGQLEAQEALRKLHEKEVLLKEIHHRVKNNLQVVYSLLGLQSRAVADESTRRMFEDSRNRIHSMALLHESLYRSDDLSQIDFGQYAHALADYLFNAYAGQAANVAFSEKLEPVRLNMDVAVPCGLILSELLSNSLKYAFPGGKAGEVRIELYESDKKNVVLYVGDDGAGFPPGFDWTQAKSLGLRLVRSLSEQLSATLEISSKKGTQVRVTFALPQS